MKERVKDMLAVPEQNGVPIWDFPPELLAHRILFYYTSFECEYNELVSVIEEIMKEREKDK